MNDTANDEAHKDESTASPLVSINRHVFTQHDFDAKFKRSEAAECDPDKASPACAGGWLRRFMRSYHPKNAYKLFTILNLVSEYDFRNYLVGDIISGLTIGILHIPTSLGYGALTSLNPIYGLYSTFFPSLIYTLFCTSRHLSVGTFAIVAIMTYSTISRLESKYVDLSLAAGALSSQNYAPPLLLLELVGNNSASTSSSSSSAGTITNAAPVAAGSMAESLASSADSNAIVAAARLKIATSLTFWCGVVQLLFAMFKFGGITKYLSQPLLRGFTSGATFHILIGQLPNIFGISIKANSDSRAFKLFRTVFQLIASISSLNGVTLAISVVSLLFLVVVKIQVNERFKRQLKNIPVPIELIVIVVGTIVSHFFSLTKSYNLAVVGKIPTGIPSPSAPDPSLFADLIADAVVISLITFATSVSIGDLYARKHKYKLDSNKEILALGISNFVGSFLNCVPAAGTLARTAVQEESGGKTQLVTIIAAFVVFLVMFFLSPLLEALPKACLGAIVVSALIHMFKQLKDIGYYWKLDKVDFATWMVTFVACIVLDIDYGLWVGIVAQFFLNANRSKNIRIVELGRVANSEIYSETSRYVTEPAVGHIKVIRATEPLFYINTHNFIVQLNAACPFRDSKAKPTIYSNCRSSYGCRQDEAGDDDNEECENVNEKLNGQADKQSSRQVILLDCSLVHFIDESGVRCLKQAILDYSKDNVDLYLANCNDVLVNFFKRTNDYSNFFSQRMFLSVPDAIESFAKQPEMEQKPKANSVQEFV